MVLNNKPQMFTFYFPSDFWYPEVVERWTPMVHRMKLPFETVDDFMNSQVQSVTFPAFNMDLAVQGRWQYDVAYYNGKELEAQIDKNIKVTFKLTESYLSYWIVWDQMDTFLHYSSEYRDTKVCWMPPVKMGFLTDSGIQLLDFTFNEITPQGTSELNLSYAATVASYNTFTFSLRYNTFSIDEQYLTAGELQKPKIIPHYDLTTGNKIESTSGGSGKNVKQSHSELTDLDYKHSGHTGFQKRLIPGEHITITSDGEITADFLSEDNYNIPNGVPQLDENGKINASQIPLPLEVFVGYYHDGKFYSDEQYKIQIKEQEESLYIDLITKSIFVLMSSEYIPVGGKKYTIKGSNNKLILSDGTTSSTITAGNGISISNNTIRLDVQAGNGISINDNEISIDLVAGDGISIEDNVISSVVEDPEWGNIGGDISEQTDLVNRLDEKQNKLIAGEGISIEDDVISSTVNSAEWGNITGNINDQEDLNERLRDISTNISHVSGRVDIVEGDIRSIQNDINDIESEIERKQDVLIAGDGISINDNIITNSQYENVNNLNDRVSDIESLVPNDASTTNQLADKNFVNSSIATNTANFLGTYNIVDDLGLTTSATEQQIVTAIASVLADASINVTNNDYVFVSYPDAIDPTQYDKFDRYKASVDGLSVTWAYEYTLNNSSFTAQQWAAINSGITSNKIAHYDLYETTKQDILRVGLGIQINNNEISTNNIVWRTW